MNFIILLSCCRGCNEKPKLLQHGAFTRAVPFKEEKFHRHVSDSIANNYSPAARDFSTHSLHKHQSNNEYSELYRLENQVGLLCQKPPYQDLGIVKKKDTSYTLYKRKAPGSWNEDHSELFSNAATRGTECQSENSVSSNCMPAFDLGLRNSEPLPPIQKQINTKEKRHPSIQSTDTSRQKNQGDSHYKSTNEPVWIADCSKYLSPPRSLPLLPASSDNADSPGLHRPLSFSQDKASHSFSTPAAEQHRELEGTKHSTQPESQPISAHTRKKSKHKSHEDWRQHDAMTTAALSVMFPPSTYSTHGLSRPATPTEGHLDRYYRLIEESIDPCMVSPLSAEWLQGIYSYIPAELCKVCSKSLQDLTKEAEENYIYAIKKSIVDYILLDPMEQHRLGIKVSSKMSNRAGRHYFPWHESVNTARIKLKSNLHITHPIMSKVLLHFYTKYANFRLLNMVALMNIVPMKLDEFINHIRNDVRKKSEELKETWLRDCCNTVTQNRENIESEMPQDEKLRRKKMDHLFCCLATLMSNLQRSIVEASLMDLVKMVETYGDGNNYEGNYPPDNLWLPEKPHLILLFMKPFLKESDVSFNPSTEEIFCGFDNTVDSLVISVQQMARIETFLFQAVDNLKIKYISSVQIHEEIVLSAKTRIRAVIENNMRGPSRYAKVYKPFLQMLSPQTEKRLETLAQKNVSLKVYARELDNVKKLASDVALLPVFVPMKMMFMDCFEINQRWGAGEPRRKTPRKAPEQEQLDGSGRRNQRHRDAAHGKEERLHHQLTRRRPQETEQQETRMDDSAHQHYRGPRTIPTKLLGYMEASIKADLTTIRTEMSQVLKRVEDTEERLDVHTKAIQELQDQCRYMEKGMRIIAYKAEDQENRNRRNNLRLRGIPETVGDRELADKIRETFNDMLKRPRTTEIIFDRVHRMRRPIASGGENPRDVIVRFHYYADKAQITESMKNASEMVMDGVNIQAYVDLALETLARRRALKPLTQALISRQITYRWGFPACLIATYEGRTATLRHPEDLVEFCEKMDITPPELCKQRTSLLIPLSSLCLPCFLIFSCSSIQWVVSFTGLDWIMLDYVAIESVESANILPMTISDHAPVELTLKNNISWGKQYNWKLNDSLLHDQAVVQEIGVLLENYFQENNTEGMSLVTVWEAHKVVLRVTEFSLQPHPQDEPGDGAEWVESGGNTKMFDSTQLKGGSVSIYPQQHPRFMGTQYQTTFPQAHHYWGMFDSSWEHKLSHSTAHIPMGPSAVCFNITPHEGTTLFEVLHLGLEKYLDDLNQISSQASKEYALEKALNKMETDWEDVCFIFSPYKDGNSHVLAAVDEIQVLLEDHIVKTTTMKGSPFIAPFEKEILAWEAKLRHLQDTLDSWLTVQMAWLYLAPIFRSADIRNQIPVEGAKFQTVDFNWRLIMRESVEKANAMRVISQPQMLDKLKEAELLLDDIQKGLNDYLEKKRLFFPRFFFLSNDELIEILSETKDPLRVQPHLKKCFEGIAKLTFNPKKEITHMESAEKEKVELVTRIIPANAKGLVEQWLHEVEKIMKLSLHEVMNQSIKAYAKSLRKEWVLQWPGQVVLASSMVHWTTGVSKAFDQKRGLQNFVEQCSEQIDEIVNLVRGRLTKMEQITLGALITIDVHARDVVFNLNNRGVANSSDFGWIAQMRYYWEENSVVVRMVTTTVPYGYEYLGNAGRLVLTPLTDRCFRTLMGALQLNICVVFNCSDGLDYKAMGKFFKGLAQSGAWACFDEFNRIELEVLSVVAQQIQTIQRAISEQVQTFVFEGTEICLDSSCTVFITMNPGYAGRAELPDNLKVLFRTVAMMVPDYTLIAEISLYSMGFVAARSLAAKIVATYRLCSEQLSSQHHYDYGMRAVKSVLTAAGNLKVKLPDEKEDVLMLRSIRDVNLPKFLSHDIPLFDSIISDLFPGVIVPTPDHGSLEVSIREITRKMNLQQVPCFIKKIIQIYEMMLVRHGFMLIGNPLGGKTSSLKVLAGVLKDLEIKGLMDEHRVDYIFINPKAITIGQLYGSFDPVSHEWIDGVLSNVFRNHATCTTKRRKWCIFDGPVDAVWVENMNTVLDDNKKLCLMSGEIIQMSPQQNMIFEVLDLEQASPATVSRCGMIYMEAKDLGWEPLTESWLAAKLPAFFTAEESQIVQSMCRWLLPVCLDFVEKKCTFVTKTSPMHLTMSMLKIYECLLANIRSAKSGTENEEEVLDIEETRSSVHHTVKINEEVKNAILAYGFFAVIWSVGGVLHPDSKKRFSEYLKNLCDQDPTSLKPKGLQIPRSVQLPKAEDVYDIVYVKKKFSAWCLWKDLVTPTKFEDIIKPSIKDNEKDVHLMLNDIIVSTPGTAMQMYFLETLLLQDKPLLFVGPTGTGKTAITNSFLRHLPQEKYVVCQINFSVQASANQTQDIFLTKLERQKKRVYGTPPGKQAFVFVDDLNMPAKEKYGAQPPIELLRQWIDHGYWFDRKDTNMIEIKDTSLVLAMAPPSGGGNAVTPRLLRHFNVLSIDAFSDETMKSIFQPVVDWHFNSGFDTSLKRYSRIFVWATMDLYRQVMASFLPMPSKSHYIFSLRDFSRVVQGIILLKPTQVDQNSAAAQKLMRLWIHEVYRVFCDRLVNSQDRKTFFQIVKNVVQSQFKEKMSNLFTHLVIGRKVQDEDMRNLFFGDYVFHKSSVKPEKHYDEIAAIEELKICMQRYLHQYNASSKTPMNLVMFHFATEHISRISRVLKLPCGHALLIGIGGTGRQSVTKLAAFMADIELHQFSIQKSYTVSEWRDDLKKVLRAAGQNGTPTVFLFAEHQIKDESFLEDINMILSTGDVPTLFNNEEKLEVMEKMRQLLPATETQNENTTSDLYRIFKDRIRRNLHIVLAFSPTGKAFRDQLRHYTSLVNSCTIDWFQAWPEDALEKVANHFLDDVEMSQEIRNEAVFMCHHFHQSVVSLSERFFQMLQRQIYVTSTSYLELIKTFKNLLERKRLELLTSKNRYMVGLEKLDFASSQIAIMQQELTELKPMLIERSSETEELVNIIADETLEVEAVKSLVEADEATANKAALEAKAIKDECEQKLSVAIPAFNAAIAALDTLKASDIALLKTMQNPPSGVRLTLSAICILKGIKPDKKGDPSGKSADDYWPASKKMLGDMKFLDSLKEFDKDNIPPKVIAQIRKDFISNPEFQPAVIKNVSSACEGLCSWVRAIEVYDKVAKIVAPKRQKLEAAEADLKIHMQNLKIKREELKEVTTKLKGLQDQLSQKLAEKRVLEENINMTKLKLDRAEKLINGLGGEKQRWRSIVTQLGDTYQNIVGDMLLSAGIVAYLGPFTSEFRQEILRKWFNMCRDKHIPISDGFALSSTLGDPVKIMEWQFHGLPKDSFSLENAIIVTSAQQWPLMIDPQGQANKWIKNMEKINKIQICKATDTDYLRAVGNSIQFGTPVLIENLTEELDPILEPVLLRQTFKQNGVEYIRLGEAVIHYSRDFKLYMTTRLRNPHYLPEVSVKVTLINFMITPIGLEDQLLTILAAEEKPDLEERKYQLYLEGATTRKQLKEIEDQILEVLSLSQGNILEDERAIDILSSSKKLSQEIQEKQEITTKTEKQIDETRDGYRPVANHSSVIFFVISDLAYIDTMYQFSLAWYINLYINAIKKSEPSQKLQERITYLNDYFTNSVYEHVCRSLFEKHKLLFSFLLCVGIQRNRGLVNYEEWHFLLTGSVALEIPRANPDPMWLKDKFWGEILRLSSLPIFGGLDDHFYSNIRQWKSIYDSSQPNEMELPNPWEDLLTDFQKLLVLRCVRPDKIISAVQQFVTNKMGPAFIDPPTFDLRHSYMGSSSSTPLIFVLSSGADPLQLLMKFAEEKDMGGINLQTISLGQGQGPIARKMIEKAAEDGTWVVLQNCHLATSWLTELEHICEEVITDPEKTNSSFRLWLTSYPSQDFPVSVLQNGIKMTNEPPKGLRANLLKSYLSDPICNPAFFNGCNKPKVWKKLLFGLCFFHALVQERRTYGSLGWNVSYEFNDSDLKISAKQLQRFINDYEQTLLDAVIYLTGECNYGGRVTDEHDRRLLLSLLDTFLCEAVITEDDYAFSPSGKYFAPKNGTHDAYMEYIKSLPLNADPEVFGLHINANITRDQKETAKLFDWILTTLPKQTSGGGKSTSEVVHELIDDILSKIPEDFNIEEVKRLYPTQYTESMNTVLVHELLRFNRLTSTIRMSLQDLNKAISGLSAMSNELDDLLNSMTVGKVPTVWSARSYPSLKPLGGYIADLLQRLRFFKEWIERGTPKVFWISGFYFTQSFLTGALQNYARKYKIPIDLLGLQFQITDHDNVNIIDSSPSEGTYINGLYMEGARWDRDKHVISESFPKILYDSMPIIWLIPEENIAEMDSFYQCPVYKTSARHGELSTTGHSTNYVLSINLPTDKSPNHWVNRGVACLCQLDY
ncbi:PREDICTED: dynein heavy chain 3, axonemal-like [Nanorana parkeri]|uniref:dynein heavy chain 3, axonemal-like n=1 Tax=Nanorana parkeri TaxID=125878 RepID=UPI000854E50B|nr:PREDICTED: dynein heavy chain 3, axonemal-like [Nanorana parkeri]